MRRIFFVIGVGRSGTTAISNILSTASNVESFVEQDPKLCIAARMKYDGVMQYPDDFIYKSKNKHISETLKKGLIYGDKNPNYLFFLENIINVWDCNILFLIRDGRDVVRSSMDFYTKREDGYVLYEDGDQYSITQAEERFWDFARIRPHKEEKVYNEWRKMDRFEKFSWGWAKYNSILLEKIETINKDKYKIINMNNLDENGIKDIFEFIGLRGYNHEVVKSLISSKINTSKIHSKDRFKGHNDWDDILYEKFNKHAHYIMGKFGFYQ